MAQEWIKAPLALKYVALGGYDFPARHKICERAHHGLIPAKAERIIWNGQEERDKLIGKRFWWAEGQEALEQDWEAGDFTTWINQKDEVKAFGVSFDFAALSELVPAAKQAEAMSAISVFGHADWISAADLHAAMFAKAGPAKAGEALAEACRLGQIGARAMRANCERIRGGTNEPIWRAIEWDVPLWFWRDFTEGKKGRFDWALGKVRGDGAKDGETQRIVLQGLHFHKSGLINLGLGQEAEIDDPAPGAKRGRKPIYDWHQASAAIWGLIVRGDLVPKNQAQIEKAMQRHLAKGDEEPSESTVRPFAKLIWDEYSKA